MAAARPIRAVVWSPAGFDARLHERTIRSLRRAGVSGPVQTVRATAWIQALAGPGPLVVMRAGAWRSHPAADWPASSATGRGLCAFGAVRVPFGVVPESVAEAALWADLLRDLSGDLAAANSDDPRAQSLFGTPACVFVDDRALATLTAKNLAEPADFVRVAASELRVAHVATLDVGLHDGLRVAEVITALQRGGAERIALDLAAELPPQGVCTRLFTTGSASRAAFEAPPGAFHLAAQKRKTPAVETLAEEFARFGADVVHAHLLSAEAMRAVGASGVPVVATVHNARPGWPEGFDALQPGDAALLVACTRRVEIQLEAAAAPAPVRTASNGIRIEAFTPSPERALPAERLRREWGFGPDDLVLVAVANPRPQKRLERLPSILAAVRARLNSPRRTGLVICGDTASTAPGAQESLRALREAANASTVTDLVIWTGTVESAAGILAASDVLVCTSAHEGLSLAHLEALAAGCGVVTAESAAAPEIAEANPSYVVVADNSSPDMFADAVLGLGTRPHPRNSALLDAPRWSVSTLAARCAGLLHAAVANRSLRGGRGLWLITNNFSTGGAQSSARRLLHAFRAGNIPVHAAVVEEQAEYSTPGRTALTAAGVSVFAAPRADDAGPHRVVTALLDALAADPPEVVVFWNLRPEIKVLLADSLWSVRVFDVSPGSMYFDSLDRFFTGRRLGLPYRTPADYGRRLAGVVVKYAGEAARARETLGTTVHVIPNGVALPVDAPASQPRSGLVLGTAARIHPQKRLEDLIEALSIIHAARPDVVLRIAGGVDSGGEAYAAELRSRTAGLPVEWLGDLGGLVEFHRSLDLFVMISEPPGCPNASLEAMAAGLPVVATDVGGAAEQVVDGVTGRLVPPRRPDSMAAAVLALAASPETLQSMGRTARGRIEAHFTLKQMTDAYRAVFFPGESA
jgi:glycosyltransferase involved in cell wall biosynthesis